MASVKAAPALNPVPGVEPPVHHSQLWRVVGHQDRGERGAEAAAAGV